MNTMYLFSDIIVHAVTGLPCRHLFAVRTSQNLPVFELQLVADRWRRNYQLLVSTSFDFDGEMEDSEAIMEFHCQDWYHLPAP